MEEAAAAAALLSASDFILGRWLLLLLLPMLRASTRVRRHPQQAAAASGALMCSILQTCSKPDLGLIGNSQCPAVATEQLQSHHFRKQLALPPAQPPTFPSRLLMLAFLE